MDISRDHLIDSTRSIAQDYPWIAVHAACVDYSKPRSIPDFGPGGYNAFFPSSSIGNFDPIDAIQLLRNIHKMVRGGGGLLIGVDLKKDRKLLEAAYNDAQGVTRDFNLNILAHINRHLHADFNLANFTHKAIYNAGESRIEMHLVSATSQRVHINGETYRIEEDVTLHTENSYKYSIDEFHRLAARAGFAPIRAGSDRDALFSIHYLKAADD
jgi:dimethylhistidine N-methyltransferase